MTLDVGGEHISPSLREVRREIDQAMRISHSAVGGRLDALCDRLDALEQARAAEPQPLPASPAPVEPAPAPETPEQTATRLLSDPQMAAEVFLRFMVGSDTMDRHAFVDELVSRCRHYEAGRRKVALFSPGISAAAYRFSS